MAEFNIQADSVDVTKIMEQIRQRIREKRGADYTEQQIRELATVKLEQFLDPRKVRSDLVDHYRQLEPLDPIPDSGPGTGPIPEAVKFDENTIYVSSRGLMGTLIRLLRRLLNPILRLFLNPDPIILAMSRQSEINVSTLELLRRQTKQMEQIGKKFAAREDLDSLNYEVLNNLVVEMTRLAVDMKNHKMQVESVAGRLDFDERRTRALETVVQSRSTPSTGGPSSSEPGGGATDPARPRRRRRRPRRRPSAATPTANNTGGEKTAPQPNPTAQPDLPEAQSNQPTNNPEPVQTTPSAAPAEPPVTIDPVAPNPTPSPHAEVVTPLDRPARDSDDR